MPARRGWRYTLIRGLTSIDRSSVSTGRTEKPTDQCEITFGSVGKEQGHLARGVRSGPGGPGRYDWQAASGSGLKEHGRCRRGRTQSGSHQLSTSACIAGIGVSTRRLWTDLHRQGTDGQDPFPTSDSWKHSALVARRPGLRSAPVRPTGSTRLSSQRKGIV